MSSRVPREQKGASRPRDDREAFSFLHDDDPSSESRDLVDGAPVGDGPEDAAGSPDGGEGIDVTLLETGRILDPGDMGNLRALEGFMQRQRALAARQLAEIDEIKERSRRESFEQGSLEAAELLASIARRNSQEQSRIFDEVVDVVMTAMRMLLERYDRAELVVEAVNKVLSEPERERWRERGQKLTLVIHPSLKDDVRRRFADPSAPDKPNPLLDIEGDRQLSPSRALLTSSLGTVELGFEQQLEALHRGLLQQDAPMIGADGQSEV